MGIVKAKNLTFEYIRRDEDGNVEGITKAVDNVSIDIKQGDFEKNRKKDKKEA